MHDVHLAESARIGKQSSRKKSTPSPDPWYKRYPEHYKRGTRKLSLAARGAYSDILDMIYMAGGPIEDDDFAIACELRVKMRQWLKVREELFAAGKLATKDGLISNAKAEEVLAERKATKRTPASRERKLNSKKERGSIIPREILFQGKPNEINGGGSTEEEEEEERESDLSIKVESRGEVVGDDAAASEPTPVDLKELAKKLKAVAGPALGSEAAYPGLAVMQFPEMWLASGCDLEQDILPTIHAITSRPGQTKITTWKYFTGAVMEAKTVREQGLPTIHRNRAQEFAECEAALASM